MGRFDDKVVVITGAGSGFGAAMARHFSAEGASLVLADINAEAVAGVVADLPKAIRVNALMPVAADTDFFLGVFGRHLSARAGESLTSSIPMGRLCQPDDVAAAGVCLPVDGGRSI